MTDDVPFRRPIRWDRLRADEAERVIREWAQDADQVAFTRHAFERVAERDYGVLTTATVLRVLREGQVIGDPERNERGHWQAIMAPFEVAQGRLPDAGRSRCLCGHGDRARGSQPARAHRHVEGLSMGTGKLFHFTQSGLDNVWLADGWRVTRTPYGPAFSIERLDELHEALARLIVESPLPMRGQDARYLRVMLDLSQADMGKLLGVSRATVIRWEGAAQAPLDRVHDIAMRATYAAHSEGSSLVASAIKALQEADDERHGPRDGRAYRAVFEARRKAWRLAA